MKKNFELEVKTQLIKKNMTLTQIAEELGISLAYASDIVRGNRKAEHYRKKIMEILGIKE